MKVGFNGLGRFDGKPAASSLRNRGAQLVADREDAGRGAAHPDRRPELDAVFRWSGAPAGTSVTPMVADEREAPCNECKEVVPRA